MAKTSGENERGGFLYDKFNRKEFAFRALNSAELLSDRPEGGVVKDVDGRELTVAAGLSAITGLVNVKDPLYAAMGDGVTDDTKAIEEAITAAGEHGAVILPKGEYLVSKALSIPYERFTLCGVGYRSSTIKLKNSSNSSVITTPDDSVQRYGLLLKDFGIEGNAANQTGESAAIAIHGMNEARIEGLYILEPRGAAITIGQATAGIFNTVPMITRCVIRGDKVNSQKGGIELNTGSSDAQVIGCDIGFFTLGGGIVVSGHNGYELIGNQCWQDKFGYQIFASSRGRIVGCLADLAKQHGFVIQNAVDSQFIGCQSRESSQETTETYDGFYLEGTTVPNTCFNTIFSGCRTHGEKTRFGINLAKNITTVNISGCDWTGNPGGGRFEGVTNVTGVIESGGVSGPEAGKELKAGTKIKGIANRPTMVYISAIFKAEETEGEIIEVGGSKFYTIQTVTLTAASKLMHFAFKMKIGAEFELKLAKGALEGATSTYVLQEG